MVCNYYRCTDYRPIILFIFDFDFISIVNISLHYYEFMTHKLKLIHITFEWMGNVFR